MSADHVDLEGLVSLILSILSDCYTFFASFPEGFLVPEGRVLMETSHSELDCSLHDVCISSHLLQEEAPLKMAEQLPFLFQRRPVLSR